MASLISPRCLSFQKENLVAKQKLREHSRLRGLQSGDSFAEKDFFSEVCKLIHLILVMPATNAFSERSFSSLRRIKTYLRSTMHHNRLNHLMMLHVYKRLTDSDMKSVANEFVAGSEHHLALFGKFQ